MELVWAKACKIFIRPFLLQATNTSEKANAIFFAKAGSFVLSISWKASDSIALAGACCITPVFFSSASLYLLAFAPTSWITCPSKFAIN